MPTPPIGNLSVALAGLVLGAAPLAQNPPALEHLDRRQLDRLLSDLDHPVLEKLARQDHAQLRERAKTALRQIQGR